MSESEVAVRIAAEQTGLSEAQIAEAVSSYRRAAKLCADEPEWRLEMHMAGKEFAMAVYGATGTEIRLQIESSVERGKWVEDGRCYTFGGQTFEAYLEAIEAESHHRTTAKAENIVPMVPTR